MKERKKTLAKAIPTSKMVHQHPSVKVALRTALMSVAYLILGAITSCEIEDEYSKPDMSENLGRRIGSSGGPAVRLFWPEQTNEIIVVSPGGVTAYGAEKNTVRNSLPVDFDNQFYSAWLVGDMIYVVSYLGKLSSIDLATLGVTKPIADSVLFNDLSPIFSTTHISYSKYRETEPYAPAIFLHDLASGKETYVASGYPLLFSPDGNQLLFESDRFYIYDLTTKAITDFGKYTTSYGAALRWTPDGVISYRPGQNYITIVVTNETTGEKIGEWNSLHGFFPNMVSPTGNSIITGNDICGYPYVIGSCPGYTKVAYSLVDVHNNTEQTLVYGPNSYHHVRAFSPDENNFAYEFNGQLYITQSQN